MKILLIDVNCKYSSTGKIVYSLFQYLNEKGHVARIAYGRGDLIDEPGIYKFGLDAETNLHAGLARITGRNGVYSAISTNRLIKYIDEFKPDVIHIHELHAYFVNIKPLMTHIKKLGCKVVWTFHCEYMYTGKCGFAFDCDRWLTGCGNCPAVGEYPKSMLFDRTKSMFAMKKSILEDLDFTVVAPSKWLAHRSRKSFLSEKDTQVIHNGIDTELFAPQKSEDADELRQKWDIGTAKSCTNSVQGCERKKVILSVAPNIMDDRKGGRTVLEIAKRAGDNHPDWHFVMIGADETQRLSDNVTAIARTKNQQELAQWYSAADVFLICSTKENFPTTCLEALCCGTPIVGIAAGGTAETAEEPFGIFVSKRDENLLIEKIQAQLEDGPEAQQVRAYAVANYSQEAMCNKYLDLYEEI